MVPPPPPPLADSLSLFVVIAAAAFSPEVAQVVGPQVLIITAAVIGASFGLSRRPPSTRLAAFFYFFRVVGLAVLMTVGIAAWLAAKYPPFTDRALLAPVALLIGFADWPMLLGQAVKAIIAAIFKTVDNIRSGG